MEDVSCYLFSMLSAIGAPTNGLLACCLHLLNDSLGASETCYKKRTIRRFLVVRQLTANLYCIHGIESAEG